MILEQILMPTLVLVEKLEPMVGLVVVMVRDQQQDQKVVVVQVSLLMDKMIIMVG